MNVNVQEMTPVASLLGGVLIGLASAAVLRFQGRVAGVSGILGGLLGFARGDLAWRGGFLAGLVAAGVLAAWAWPASVDLGGGVGTWAVVLGGLLVGFGTRLANGCTSGHGVCGISRLSPRSLAATGVFMAAGVASVFVVRHLIGGGL
ncbi:MAG: YeeE/YedE family protein [Myxococcales bacterium]|nr:YeeE/YedE family protein [Myxococcales bacterium]